MVSTPCTCILVVHSTTVYTLTHLQFEETAVTTRSFSLGAFLTLTACLLACHHQRWWLWPNWHIFKRDAIALLSLYYCYLSWTRKSVLCDMALREFFFWEATKVVLHVNAKLLIQCLVYLPGPCDERLLRIGKVSVTASDVRNVGKKSNFVHEKIIDIRAYKNSQSFKDANVTIPARGPAYLRRVSCRAISLHFVLWLEIFSSSFL